MDRPCNTWLVGLDAATTVNDGRPKTTIASYAAVADAVAVDVNGTTAATIAELVDGQSIVDVLLATCSSIAKPIPNESDSTTALACNIDVSLASSVAAYATDTTPAEHSSDQTRE